MRKYLQTYRRIKDTSGKSWFEMVQDVLFFLNRTFTKPVAITALFALCPLSTAYGETPKKDISATTRCGEITKTYQLLAAKDCTTVEKIDIEKTNLTEIHLPKLKKITGRIDITYNHALTEISLPKLEAVMGKTSSSANVYIAYNHALTLIDLPKLERGTVNIQSHLVLKRIHLPKLMGTDGIMIYNNSVLPSISLPDLKTGVHRYS